jgi:hypothetical protein
LRDSQGLVDVVKHARELLAGAVLVGAGIMLAVAMLEIGVRWLHLVPDRFWEPDAVLGVKLIPGDHGWWTQEDREFVVPVQINRQGLRDVEHEYAKAPDVFRVLVIGDSFVEAMHVPLDATFGRLLEQQLNVDGAARHVEVVSAGVSGYGTASELLYFQHHGKRYQPDLVVLSFYPGNDVKNNSPSLEDTLKPVYAADGALERVVGEAPKKRPHGWRGLVARSKAYHYLRQLLLVRHPQLAHSLIRHGLLKGDAVRTAGEHDGIPVDYGVYAATVQPDWQDAWQHTERLLTGLQEAVAASGAQFAVAVIGTRDQVYPRSWQEIVSAHPRMHTESWDLDGPQHRVERWCAARGVPCLALAPAFRETAAHGGDPLYFRHDGHWTVAGHRLAANAIRDFLEQHRLVPTRPTRSAQ